MNKLHKGLKLESALKAFVVGAIVPMASNVIQNKFLKKPAGSTEKGFNPDLTGVGVPALLTAGALALVQDPLIRGSIIGGGALATGLHIVNRNGQKLAVAGMPIVPVAEKPTTPTGTDTTKRRTLQGPVELDLASSEGQALMQKLLDDQTRAVPAHVAGDEMPAEVSGDDDQEISVDDDQEISVDDDQEIAGDDGLEVFGLDGDDEDY